MSVWQPVITVLIAALVVLIPGVTVYLKVLLDRQTVNLQQNIRDVARTSAQSADQIVSTVESGHQDIVREVQSIKGG